MKNPERVQQNHTKNYRLTITWLLLIDNFFTQNDMIFHQIGQPFKVLNKSGLYVFFY